MSLKENILKLTEFLLIQKKTKDQRFLEFHQFHKWCLENIDPVLWEKIGRIYGISVSTSGSYLELSLEDYKGWAIDYENSHMLIKPIKEIEKMFYDRLVTVLHSEQLPATKEQISEVIKTIDDVFLNALSNK